MIKKILKKLDVTLRVVAAILIVMMGFVVVPIAMLIEKLWNLIEY